MPEPIREIESAESFSALLKEVKGKAGKELLSDNDLFVCACEKILQAYTFEEREYR